MARALLGLSDSSTIFAKMTNISIVLSDEIEDVSNYDKKIASGLKASDIAFFIFLMNS